MGTLPFETALQQLLRQPLVDVPLLYIDYWSGVHLLSGIFLGALFRRYYRKKIAALIVFGLLVIYEFFELLTNGIIFVPETPLDTVWDLVVGMIGYSIGRYIMTYLLNKKMSSY